ncbi:MAG: hypothetical protein QXX83_07150 [Thermofilum sp.]
MDWQEGERIELTADDAIYVLSMLDSIGSKLASAQEVPLPLERVSIAAIDLDALAQSMFGITDPIGQLSRWLSDQLKSFSSWIASSISTLIRNLWDSFISPALSALSRSVGDVMSSLRSIGDVVNRVMSALANLPGAIVSSIRAFFESLASSINSVLGAIGSLRDAVSSMIGGAVSSIVSTLQRPISSILSLLSGVASAIGSGFSALQGAIGGISNLLSGLADAFSSGVRSLLDSLGRVPALVGEVLSPLLRGLQDAILSALKFAVENLTLAFTGIVSRSTDSLLSALGGLGNALGGAVAAVADGISRIGSSLGDLIARGIGALTDLTGRVLSAVSALPSLFHEALRAVGGSIMDALYRAAGGIMSGLEGLGRALSSFAQQATDFLSGLASRIESGFGELGRLVATVAASVGEALRPAVESITTGFAEFSKLLSMAADSLKQLGAILTGFVNSILQLPGLLQNAFGGFLEGISGGIKALADAFMSFLKDPLGTLKAAIDWFVSQLWKMVPDWLKNALEGALAELSRFRRDLEKLMDGSKNLLELFAEWLARQLWNLLPDWLKNALETAGKALDSLRRAIESFLRDPWGSIVRAWQELANWIWERLPDWMRNALEAVGRFFDNVLKGYQEFFKDPLGYASRTFQLLGKWLWDMMPDWMRNVLDRAGKALEGIRMAFESFLKDPWGSISRAWQMLAGWIWERLPDWLKNALDTAGKALENLRRALEDFAKDPWGSIVRAWQELANWIWERLPDWMKNALEAAGRALESLRRAIEEFMKDPWGSIVRAFQELGRWIWERLPEPVKGFFSWLGELAAKAGQVLWELFTVHIPGFFRWVWEGIQAFIKDPLGFLYNNVLLPLWNGLQWLWNEIYKQLPDWVRNGIDMVVKLFTEQIPAFLKWLWEGFQAFIQDPIGFLQKYIIQPFVDWIKKGLQWLWEQVGNFLATLTSAMKTIANAMMSAAAGLGLGLASSAAGLVSGALGSLLGIAQSVSDAAKTVFKQVAERMAREAAKWYSETYTGILGKAGVASPEFLKIGAVEEAWAWAWAWSLTLFTEPLWGRMVGNMLGWGLKKTGAMISGFTPRASAGGGGRGGASVRGHARGKMSVGAPAGPSAGGSGGASGGADASLGASVRFSFDAGRAIGGAFWTFGEEIASYATELGRALQYGLGIWLGRVYVAPIVYHLRNLAPLFIPPDSFWVEVVRRFTPHPQAKEMEKVARLYLGFGGWSDFFTDLIMMEAEKLNIVVTDRFQRPRAVPLALRYVMPSVYDAATMMVRDAFADPQDFIRLAEALGIYKDVAVFYALLRYRYPAPSDLAKFYWRGVTGLLWSPGLPKEAGSLQALGLGYDPAAPKALNLKADVLNRMIAAYLRWQDYFPLAWEKGFAADIDVYHELTADLPTKIDSRWMMKWGIFEHLAALGATLTTPVEELAGLLAKASGKELLKTRVEKGLTVDVTMLARLIEATGMHPYWVPLIAVAEGINAVADEKTMVRTSIITMYKEGLISLDNAEALLSGALVQNVLTGYIDPATGKPVTFTYRMPIMWLPIERRLMQMKAVVDRVVDLFRDLSSVIARAVRLRVYRAGEAVEAFRRAVQMAQRHLLDELGRLTDVPIQLAVDESYLRFYAEVQEVVSDVEISIFLRTMAQRLLGWILMRVAYGYVRESDFAELLDALVKGFRLTPAEAEAIRGLFSVLYKVAAREMIPTPSQLGTFAEYMVVPPDVVARVLAEHRVPSEYWDLWMRYIQVKPLKSDYRSLLTAAARAYRRGALRREDWERLLREARQFGFTDAEIDLLRRRVELELVSAGTEEYIPPLSTLASMVEYIDISPELIARVLEARGVTEPWMSLWTQYVLTRSIASEVNTLVSTFRRIYEYFTMPEEFVKRMMALMRAGGWTMRELEVFQLDLELRKAYRIMSTLTPTVRQFVADALYIGDWEKLLDDLMRARGVDVQKYKEQVEYYKRLIKSRKMARRISWYITRVTNAAAYGVITLQDARARLEKLKRYGLDDDEINLILDGIQLQKAYTEARRR